MWRCSSTSSACGHALDVLLDPPLLLGVGDVHVLDAERPAVGVAQEVEDLVERRHVPAGQAVGHEPPRQVPDGEPVGQRVELGVRSRAGSTSSGSRWAIRWPRTRYMLISVWTWTCLTSRWCVALGRRRSRRSCRCRQRAGS